MAFNYPQYSGYGQQNQPLTPQQMQHLQMQQYQQQMQQPVQPMQYPAQQNFSTENLFQNVSFFIVPSKKEVDDYPIAPGNSVGFFCPKEKMIYVKTNDKSPFTDPVIEDYLVIKNKKAGETSENSPSDGVSDSQTNSIEYATKEQFDALSAKIERLNEEYGSTVSELETLSDVIKVLTTKKPTSKAKKEDSES